MLDLTALMGDLEPETPETPESSAPASNFSHAGTLADQIKEMLGAGIDAIAISRAVGCDPSYISQLMAESEYKEEVQTRRVQNLMGASNRDRKLEALEDMAMERLEVGLQFVMKPMEAARILSIVNGTKRRGVELNGQQVQSGAPTVVLNLPAVSRINFSLNSASQVVDVEGRSMAPLPTAKLIALAKDGATTATPKEPSLADRIGASDLLARMEAPAAPAPEIRNVIDSE